MTHSDQTDTELYYEVVPDSSTFMVIHKASRRVIEAGLGCLEATALAERLTEHAHRDSEELLA